MSSKIRFLLVLFFIAVKASLFAQPSNDNCSDAIILCPFSKETFSNIEATSTNCSNCEDDFNFCFIPNTTIWFKFTTNQYGGAVLLSFTNMQFENAIGQGQALQAALIEAVAPCAASSYNVIGNCVTGESTNFTINHPNLLPNTTYYLVVGGSKDGNAITIPAECTFDLELSGTSVNRGTPSMLVEADKLSICKNDVVTYTVEMNNCPDSTNFKWFVNDTLVAITNAPTYQTASLKHGDVVSVQTTCFKVCIDTVLKKMAPISVYTVNVDAGSDMTAVPGNYILLKGETNATKHYWSPGFLTTDSTDLVTPAYPIQNTTFVLTAEIGGCKAYDYLNVDVFEDIIIPTTFTPNGDGINDFFEIKYIENYPSNYIEIFDKWGQLVYKIDYYSYFNHWDGSKKDKDKEYAEGVYYYHLELRDPKNRVYTGAITILK